MYFVYVYNDTELITVYKLTKLCKWCDKTIIHKINCFHCNAISKYNNYKPNKYISKSYSQN